jgi:hypothetical protein
LPEASPSKKTQEPSERGGFREALPVPAKISAENLLRAITNVSDKGGKGSPSDLIELYGGKKKGEMLSRSLAFAEELGFLEKEGYSFSLKDEGRKFLSLSNDNKRAAIQGKLIAFSPYKDVLIRMKGEADHKLKKETITEMWANIAGGGGKAIRSRMTFTFASLSEYAGLIVDSGMTCTLVEKTIPLLEAGTPPTLHGTSQQPAQPNLRPQDSQTPQSPQIPIGFSCPKCGGVDLGILDEEPVQYFKGAEQTIVYVKYKLLCRGCKESFFRHGQQAVPGFLNEGLAKSS